MKEVEDQIKLIENEDEHDHFSHKLDMLNEDDNISKVSIYYQLLIINFILF